MGSKALLVLVMFLSTILLISADVVQRDFDENFDKNDGDLATNGVDESKLSGGPYPWRDGYGGPWRGGGRYCTYGCCYRGYYGCRRCCMYPGEHLDVGIDARTHN